MKNVSSCTALLACNHCATIFAASTSLYDSERVPTWLHCLAILHQGSPSINNETLHHLKVPEYTCTLLCMHSTPTHNQHFHFSLFEFTMYNWIYTHKEQNKLCHFLPLLQWLLLWIPRGSTLATSLGEVRSELVTVTSALVSYLWVMARQQPCSSPGLSPMEANLAGLGCVLWMLDKLTAPPLMDSSILEGSSLTWFTFPPSLKGNMGSLIPTFAKHHLPKSLGCPDLLGVGGSWVLLPTCHPRCHHLLFSWFYLSRIGWNTWFITDSQEVIW